MQARGPLMIEHRLIERVLGAVRKALLQIEGGQGVDPVFIDTVVDFIRTYADRTHHGKEEDILFEKLKLKKMAARDLKAMQELVQEHVLGRETTRQLVEANQRHRSGDPKALTAVAAALRALAEFYPNHIMKEDQDFFPSIRRYFLEAEEQALLVEFREFDQQMIHEKYASVAKMLEGSAGPSRT